MKEEFFSKFKDYNAELEKILEKKDFSKDSKSLLLSMFYKLETSYNDYEIVKRNVKTKQEFLENILLNIKQCNKIELVKPGTQEFKNFEEKNIKYDVDLKLKRIKVINNELYLFESILELNDFKIYLIEKYNLIRNSFPYLLNCANDMQKTELLRDFNAFSWNTSVKDIEDINVNLLYMNLAMALSFDIINKLENTNDVIDVIHLISEDLIDLYDEKIATKFLNLLFKLSIIVYIEKSDIECKRLLEEKEVIEVDLNHIKDKKNYINDVVKSKLELSNKVKELDLILNDKNLLNKEYEKRNSGKSNYNKIFSLSHLTEKLQRERERTLKKIEECNRNLEPKQYLANKAKLQNDFNLLKGIKFGKDNKKILYKNINDVQVIFLDKILPKRIEKANTKEEMIELLYKLRYYCLIPYNEEKEIKDVKAINEKLNNLLSLFIKKMYSFKLISTLSTNEKNDIEIVKNIFSLRTISLKEIYMELFKIDENLYKLSIFDDKDTLEKSIELRFRI